jgi:hypothetical protein
MTEPLLDLTVIIPSYNTRELAAELSRLDLPGRPTELLVVAEVTHG